MKVSKPCNHSMRPTMHSSSYKEAAFTEHLEYVVAADPDALPEVAVENRKEQAKAKALLANMDEYFAE